MFSPSSKLINDCDFTEQCKQLTLCNDEENIKRESKSNCLFMENKGLRMMQKMGYTTGAGLGKNEQGIREPIIESIHLGHRGLGFTNGLPGTREDWDFLKEEVNVEQKVQWLERTDCRNFLLKKMRKWVSEGKPKVTINEDYLFCDKNVLDGVNKGKDIFDELDLTELNVARAKANPFETIRSAFFINRAALKMANIDAATDFMFTNIDGNKHHKSDGPFYFADVCAGPGGFTEYILWRKRWLFKGFGLTLKDENDFRLGDSTCASPTTFQSFYGLEGDGNVCNPDNIKDFRDKVLWETDKMGVHFMMADGGFSVEGNENLQEVLSKNIYICQCLVALEILREHGHFVTKLFDVFTTFSVGLLFLMYHCFEKVAIFKPNASRPANSERYFICSNMRPKSNVVQIKNYLWHVVNRLWNLTGNTDIDVVNIVPIEVIKNDETFYKYIVESNNVLGRKQIVGLDKLAAFCRNPSLVDVRQEDLRVKCLHYWNVPDRHKIQRSCVSDEQPNWAPDVLSPPRHLNKENMEITVSDLEDWHYCPMYCPQKSNNCYFYAGVGHSKVYRYQKDKWVKVKNMHLTKGTLLYGEFVKEKLIRKSNDNLMESKECHKYCLHVIDALSLGETKLMDLKFNERMKEIKIYCKAVNRDYQDNTVRLRAKIIKPLRSLTSEPLIKKDKLVGRFFSELPVIGYNSLMETIDVNSVLLLKTNDNQTFRTTYVLRVQIFLNSDDDNEENYSFDSLLSYIKDKSVL